ncbi:ATP-binding protein [Phocaeicola vulgatus]|uniref:ATP-binding protein n=1 Tax=Phocaeicola vulgatus TaxID=821 RepID=UPI0032E4038A
MKLLLQHRILFGYIILIAVIGSMAATMLHERGRVHKIEEEITEIREANQTINAAHRHITILATLGESAITWDEEDFQKYQLRRQKVDSLLQILQRDYGEFISFNQIDTFRILLANKEEHLFHTMKIHQRQDSLLLEQLPAVTEQAIGFRTVTRKKKGIAGFFGAKETVQVPMQSNSLHSLNKQLISRQQQISENTDSLRVQNKELNSKLSMLLQELDGQSQTAFQNKEQHIKESYERSAVIVTVLIITAIILLMVSYWIIQRDIRTKERAKREQEELINKLHRSLNENDALLDARRQTLQTIIHELRSPLTAICGNIELIATDSNSEERIRHIQIIQFSAGRMSSMLGNLMNYFRLDNGKEQVCPKPFRLKCITNTLGREFLPLMEKKKLAFNIDACENEIVTGDKNMILRIGSNLLSNAVKFTERGNITLKTAYSNGVFTLEVSDTGCGITEQQREKIFNPFERLTNAATQDGFGLGLPIVKELVSLMEGKIYVESMTGSGSRFTVCIPLSKADEGFVEKDNILNDFKNLQDTSVLILDNDPVQLTMTRDMSVRYGIGCDTCRNVDELLNMMRERKYDLLITDMKMPDMNGYEVLELLRSSDIGNSRNIPIVVSTALDKSAEKELLSKGFCGCLFKPFSAKELLETISHSVAHQTQKQEISLSPLLAYGDNTGTLERLITETKKEMEEIREAYEKKDMAGLDNMIHHLRSSWMLINADHPLRELYDLIHKPQYKSEELYEKVQAVLNKGNHIIRIARKTKEGLWEK